MAIEIVVPAELCGEALVLLQTRFPDLRWLSGCLPTEFNPSYRKNYKNCILIISNNILTYVRDCLDEISNYNEFLEEYCHGK